MYIEERDDAIDLRKDENIQVRHELDFDYLSLLGLLQYRIAVLVNKRSKNGTYDLLNAWDRENIYLIYSKIFLVHVASVLVSTLGRVVKRLRLSDSDEMKFALASFFVDRKKVELIGIKNF